MSNEIIKSTEQQFGEVVDIILHHKSRATKAVNEELLLTAWQVGGYVSAKLKSEEWGSKVVSQLSEYIRTQRPDIKGYSRSSIYNMVMFYDEYSSETFITTVEKYLSAEFVLPLAAQITWRFFVDAKAMKNDCSIYSMLTRNIWQVGNFNAASPIRPMRLC